MNDSYDSQAHQNHPYEALTPDRVIDAVEAQGYLSDARILALNSYENRVYQVGMEEGPPLIAKFYRPNRWTDEQIIEEHQFTLELADLDIPVVPPLVNAEGQSLHHHGGFRLALYPREGGHAPELDQLDNLMVMGRFLGRIHAAGQQRAFKTRPEVNIQSYAIDSYEFLRGGDFIPLELEAAYCTLCEDLIARVEQIFSEVQYRSIRLHGDCHPGNILWREDRPHFVDFDDARSGPAIQDLWMLLSGERDQQSLQMQKLLEGYQQFCDLDLAELQLVESLRSLRIMHYAAWLARRWDDPAFPMNFPWFNTQRYWSQHILELREQLAALNEPPLQVLI
ncbi:serine/threonine protein kinase [Gilvimarinus sp. F26214L]|uniref:serine/threonine protein kinase n=1 Tax=Gilvimarinus sp. DZF01 TaxID=3461371 RepID=UPI00404528FE